ncbi:MAG: aminoacyl-tRNA hydrolase [Anaerolineae bacterium]|nr:aminoacyl-tRNA hydrolase [Anaerolineae bacterium]
MAERYLIVGLGNPGREYQRTRHNIGFRAVEAIASAYGLSFERGRAKSQLADGLIAGQRVLLAKPQTYMNLSGEAVRALLDFYKIPLERLLVICDDLDIPPGALRIRQKGGSGGQKGLKSIGERLGTQEFARMRIGIGRPPGRMDPAAYVLQDFGADEQILIIETLDRVVKSIQTWLEHGIGIMMTRHNGAADEAAHNASAVDTKTAKAAQPAQPTPTENRPSPPSETEASDTVKSVKPVKPVKPPVE